MNVNKQQEIDFRALFEAVPGLYLILWPDLTIAAVNNAYLQATMTKREEITGRHLFEVFPDNPEDKTATGTSNLQMSLNTVLNKRTVHTMAIQKYDIRRTDGSFEERFWNPVNIPVLNADGEIKYIIHRVEDVTQFIRLKEEEAERIKTSEELRSRLGEMEIEIYKRAQEIQKMNNNLLKEINERKNAEKSLEENLLRLETANKELEAFTYSVSHDLRAPLRAINGYTKILFEDHYEQLNEDGKNSMNIVMRNTRKMGRLIDDLLSFSRYSKIEMAKAKTDLHRLAETVIREHQNQYAEKPMEVVLKELEPSLCDINMIRQVWQNLISNAFKYSSKKDKIHLEIGCYPENDMQVYYVKDKGVGFDMNYADKLFGVFQRLHKMDQFEGTGVGLAIVQRIIARHGGRVWAEAKINEGAAFYFSLPKTEPYKIID
jgi:PAS domain S-box-containing protein